ncbi:response regulator [Pelovirga terrestris]|uniref:Response regulator n=1 Tax=Pelovirga terrestris TaxID=2771352 RepID=A0A8J6QNL7_9BACT|nr:response regulator [Pelovirga terrestris]MBD1399656.1 response regulator [Pelovirga terrestris]
MTKENSRVILHAEDEPAHAAIVRLALRHNAGDVQLRQVEDGRSALDYLYRRGPYENSAISPRPDLVLLDLRMPHVSGLEVLAIVKKDPELQTIPVVVLTTSDIEEDRSEARACGVDGYLTKPVDFDKFVSMISELCNTWL